MMQFPMRPFRLKTFESWHPDLMHWLRLLPTYNRIDAKLEARHGVVGVRGDGCEGAIELKRGMLLGGLGQCGSQHGFGRGCEELGGETLLDLAPL